MCVCLCVHWGRGTWELCVLTAQFCYEPKTSLNGNFSLIAKIECGEVALEMTMVG